MIDRLEPRLQFATIAGTIWNDADSSQTFDRTEKTRSGMTVFIDANKNGELDAGEQTTTTDKRGRYAFEGLAKGTYTIGTTADPADLLSTNVTDTGTTQGRFNINITGLDNATAAVRAAFQLAERHWESIITGDMPDVTLRNGTKIDDLTIAASVGPIDGLGTGGVDILGQSNATAFRSGSNIPYQGFMEFDAVDLAALQQAGQLNDVILHEMGHVLGFGTIWRKLGLLEGFGSRNPRFVGTNATNAYNEIFNTDNLSVPVENTYGGGTRNSHWREDVLQEELMTGFEGTVYPTEKKLDVPLSRITVGQFADEGYEVNMNAADDWDPVAHTVKFTQATDIGGVAQERQVRVSAGDKVGDLSFGYRDVVSPAIGSFGISPSPAAVNRTVVLSAKKIVDGNGVNIQGVSFWRESNGTPGLQKGEDTFIGTKTKANDRVFSISTSTAGLSGDQTFYAYATDTQGYTGHATRVLTVSDVDSPPDAPQNLSIRQRSSSVVRMSFSDDSEAVSLYRVELSTSADFTTNSIIDVVRLPSDTMVTTLTGLTAGKRYYVRVRGQNVAGASPYSDVTIFETT